MKSFAERNPLTIGAVGLTSLAVLVTGLPSYDKLPGLGSNEEYSAYFAESGGIMAGAPVEVAGLRVGKVESVGLDGPRVLVTFNVDKNIHLGDRTEAAIKTKSLLGAKLVDITPRGDGRLSETIPLDRTKSPYQLPDALGDLATVVRGLDTNGLQDALTTLAQTFKDTPPDLRIAVEGVARFSQTLGNRDAELRKLLENANKATGVLAQRADEVVSLIANAQALLAQLQTESSALDQFFNNVKAVSQQALSLIKENREQLRPALDKLNGLLTLVDNRKQRLQLAIKYINQYTMSLGESVASGPFFKAYVANLLPGQFLQPFVDAAFSDLGLDPNVLLPSQRTDPPTGQPGTPPLPVPYPRTGQGGEPNVTLPDAITGKPGDPRYPYREPLPAPPPGGPPPGPPALPAPGADSTPMPTPSPVVLPAPGEPEVPHDTAAPDQGSGGQ
jgi:phospholipid/cholesterol/gamma-HCH transport system substrate-binding protein